MTYKTTHLIILGLLLWMASCKTAGLKNGEHPEGYTAYVNPFIGTAPLTDSAILGYRLPQGWRSWAGLVFPGSSLPNAMVQLSPMTEYGSGAGYEYEDTLLYGFTHTNKGHWNLCNIPVLPVSGATPAEARFGSRFSHRKEKASPGYYQVYLEDYQVQVSLTSTLRCGYHHYKYNRPTDRQILFDLGKANNRVQAWSIEQVGDSALQGYQQVGEGRVYFYARLNSPIQRLEKKSEGTREGYALVHLRDGALKGWWWAGRRNENRPLLCEYEKRPAKPGAGNWQQDLRGSAPGREPPLGKRPV
jgi:hypothetical protein